MTNKYPLLLITEQVNSPPKANTYTKTDIYNTYENTRVTEGKEEKMVLEYQDEYLSPLTMPRVPRGAPSTSSTIFFLAG